jgi:hypothetical protein
MPGPEAGHCLVVLTEQSIDGVLGRDAFVGCKRRAVQESGLPLTPGIINCLDIFEALHPAPDIDHMMDTLFNEPHRIDDLADALAGNVLEIAGLEDADHLLHNLSGNLLIASG